MFSLTTIHLKIICCALTDLVGFLATALCYCVSKTVVLQVSNHYQGVSAEGIKHPPCALLQVLVMVR